MKCGSNKCNNEAIYIVYWPGQTIFQCEICKNITVNIGSVMGFHVSYNQIEVKNESDMETSPKIDL